MQGSIKPARILPRVPNGAPDIHSTDGPRDVGKAVGPEAAKAGISRASKRAQDFA